MNTNLNRITEYNYFQKENKKVFNYQKDDPRDFVSKDFIADIKALMVKYAYVLERLKADDII